MYLIDKPTKIPPLIYLMFFLFSCGGGWSDYSEELSGGYTYWNEGEGLNIITAPSGKIKPLLFLKKYDDNGRYISAWQADSAEFFSIMNKSSKLFKRNTYYSSDRFYIVDVKTHELMGPFTKNEFFSKTEELGYTVEWKPVIIDLNK